MKKIKIILFTFFLSFITEAQMVLEYDIATANTQIGIPLTGTVNVTVNWGDGTTNQTFTTAGIKNHTYTTSGTKTVTITGSLTAYGSGANSTYNARLTKVLSWDGLGITSFNLAFNFATLLTQVPNSLPTTVTNLRAMFIYASAFNQPIGTWNTKNITDMSGMFYGANAFNQPIGNWNTLNVTNMHGMFAGASSFNQPIGNWSTQNVTDMGTMFAGANDFNQAIGNWNTQNVTNMFRMFYGASAFNQPIGNWNTQNVTNMSGMFGVASVFNQAIGNWNTQNVTDMSGMFGDASAFNQAIGNWNTQNVTNMSEMFGYASAFNQAIGNWKLNSAISMTNMLYGSGLDCSNYSATLRGWAKQPTCPSNIYLGTVVNGSTNRNYNSTAKNAHDLLVNNKGWTITDDAYVNTLKTINITSCGSYKNYTQSGVYQDTLWGKNTCDSILVLNLIIKKSNSTSQTINACNSYKSPSGKRIYTESGIYKDTLVNKNGCDSIITLTVKISKPSKDSINITTCKSFYTSPSGSKTFDKSGVYNDTLVDKNGCDSILTINLRFQTKSSEIKLTRCNSYLDLNGEKLSKSGTYHYTITDNEGCDSMVTLSLTIDSLSSLLSYDDISHSLSSLTKDANYQWFNCLTGKPVKGATQQTFTPDTSGIYGVHVSKNSCAEISSFCNQVELAASNLPCENLVLYPNPGNGLYTLNLGCTFKETSVEIFDINNLKVYADTYLQHDVIQFYLDQPSGVYLVRVTNGNRTSIIKLMHFK